MPLRRFSFGPRVSMIWDDSSRLNPQTQSPVSPNRHMADRPWNTAELAVSFLRRHMEAGKHSQLCRADEVNPAAHSGRTHMNVQALLVRRRGVLASLGVAVVATASLLFAEPAQA